METDLDEDVVFENSELHRHLLSNGFTDFESAARSGSVGCKTRSSGHPRPEHMNDIVPTWLRVLQWLKSDDTGYYHSQCRSVLLQSRLMLEHDVSCVAEFHRDAPAADSGTLLQKATLAILCSSVAMVFSSIFAPLSAVSAPLSAVFAPLSALSSPLSAVFAPLSVLSALPFVWHGYRRWRLRRDAAYVRRFVRASGDVTAMVNRCVQCLSEGFLLCRGTALALGYTDDRLAFRKRFGAMLDITHASLHRLCEVYREAIVKVRLDCPLNESVFDETDELEILETNDRTLPGLKRMSGVFVLVQSLFVRRLCLCTCREACSGPGPRLPPSSVLQCVAKRLTAQWRHLLTAYRYHVVAAGSGGTGGARFSSGSSVYGTNDGRPCGSEDVPSENTVDTVSNVTDRVLADIHTVVMQCEAATAAIRLIEEEIRYEIAASSGQELPTTQSRVAKCLESVRRRFVDLAALCDKMGSHFGDDILPTNKATHHSFSEQTVQTNEGSNNELSTCDQLDAVDEFLEAVADGGMSDNMRDSQTENDVKFRQRRLFTQDLLSELDVVLEDKRSEWVRREAFAKNRLDPHVLGEVSHRVNCSDPLNAAISASDNDTNTTTNHNPQLINIHGSPDSRKNLGDFDLRDSETDTDLVVENETLLEQSRASQYTGIRHEEARGSADRCLEDTGFPLHMAAQAAAIALRRRRNEQAGTSSDDEIAISD